MDSQSASLLNTSAVKFLFQKEQSILYIWLLWILFSFVYIMTIFVTGFYRLYRVDATSLEYGNYQGTYGLFQADWYYTNGTSLNETTFEYSSAVIQWAQVSGVQQEVVVGQTMWGLSLLLSLYSIVVVCHTLIAKDRQRVMYCGLSRTSIYLSFSIYLFLSIYLSLIYLFIKGLSLLVVNSIYLFDSTNFLRCSLPGMDQNTNG